MIQTGDIAMVHTPFNWRQPLTIISFLIRKVTGFFWNHNMTFYTVDGLVFVVESDISGVVIYPIYNINPSKIVKIYRLPDPGDKNRLLSRIHKTKYDFRGLFIHGLVKEYLGIWIGPTCPGAQYEKFTCCEFVLWWRKQPDAYKSKPSDVEKYCLENQGTVVYEGSVKNIMS